MITAIYVITRDHHGAAHVRLAVARLRALADRLIVVAAEDEAAVRADLSDSPPDRVLSFVGGPVTTLAGYALALAELGDGASAPPGPVVMMSADAFGPFGDLGAAIAAMQRDGIDLLAPYWHAPALDPRLKSRRDLPARLPYLDLAVFSPALLAEPEFAGIWRRFRSRKDRWGGFLALSAPLAAWMENAGRVIRYALAEDRLETADPRLSEVHKLVEDGAPCLPVEVLTLDPLAHDLHAIDLRAALDGIRGADPELYAAVIAFATRRLEQRHFATVADQYEVIAAAAVDPAKTAWRFGTVAVFIHAFYAAMMPEFWVLIERLPCPTHLFLTTASEADKAEIETFLESKYRARASFTVRVVEQNRGRDMSSLFITWRDVVLEGGYEVALRLHSKRTPQVSRQVGENFKQHLFENLVASPGHVSNILDRFEAEPDIGLVMPPVIQIGFGTLGHAWFNNKSAVHGFLREMGLEVPLDQDTPVAPLGTMYWFRTAALAPMFRYRWRWEDYNPEPHHVDGGLAHVQERLIGYVVQGSGYRILMVMTPRLAARYYAKLEYKMQRVAAQLMSGHILDQVAQVEAAASTPRTRVFRALQRHYGRLLIRYPGLRAWLLPLRDVTVALLNPGERRR